MMPVLLAILTAAVSMKLGAPGWASWGIGVMALWLGACAAHLHAIAQACARSFEETSE